MKAGYKLSVPSSLRKLAFKHRINLGIVSFPDGTFRYYVRDPQTLQEVETTVSSRPTVAQGMAMLRRYLRKTAASELVVARRVP